MVNVIIFSVAFILIIFIVISIKNMNHTTKSIKTTEPLFFDKYSTNSLDNLINEIHNSIIELKKSAKKNNKFSIIEKFIIQINEFEEIIPKIQKTYESGIRYLISQPSFESELNLLENKVKDGSIGELESKILTDRKETLNEINNIKATLDENIINLKYIKSCIEKIRSIVEAENIKTILSENDATSINNKLEAFSDGIKESINKMKL